jgi:hypothetical protein
MSTAGLWPIFLKSLNFDNTNPVTQTRDVPAFAAGYGASSKKSAFRLRFSNYVGQVIRVLRVDK